MFCQNCGKELPAGARFCGGCGAPVPAAEAAPEETLPLQEAAPAQEPVTEAPQEAAPAEEGLQLEPLQAAAPATAMNPLPENMEQNEPILGQKKNRGKALILLAVIAVAAVAVVAGAVKLLTGSGGGGKPAYVYLTGDDELMFLKDLKADADKVRLSDEDGGYVRFSPDGKYLFFGESEDGSLNGDLYRMEIAKIGKDGVSPEKVSSDVSLYSYEMLKNGKAVFLRSSGDRQLRYYDGSESYKLASGVEEFTVNEAETYTYYTVRDEGDYTLDVYRIELKADSEKERLVKGANGVLTDLDADTLVYTEERDGGYAVYSIVPGGEKEKLASDVYTVEDVHVSGGKVSLLYLSEEENDDGGYNTYSVYHVTSGGEKEKLVSGVDGEIILREHENGKISFVYARMDVEEHTLYEFVTDSLAASDANIREPDYDDYRTVDPFWGWSTVDWDAYYEDWNVYREANSRQGIRENLKESNRNFISYTVTGYDNGQETVIAKDMDEMAAYSVEDDIWIYTKQEGEVRTVADLKDLSSAYEIYGLLDDGGDEDTVWYQNVKGTESRLSLDEEYTPTNIYILNGGEAVLQVRDEDYDYALLRYTAGKDGLTAAGTVTDEPYCGLTVRETKDGKDALYFFTDLDGKNGTGELVRFMNGEKSTVAKEAQRVMVLSDGKTVLKIDEVEYNTRREADEGSLYTVKDGKSEKIAGEVQLYSITCLDAGQILYISDGDLYLWNGSAATRLASDVARLWASEEMEYDSYYCSGDWGW